ncbi:helix-turn-helix domain-containing protein [Streptomyces tendae]|uniref:helix-turn-helix domain-containing protein n=1 Tax=Streptomyces tendae TaxID=1932 RepID=UPI00248F7018|nr:helix-turn-helix domain-containing protein [Streptomyces tendae]
MSKEALMWVIESAPGVSPHWIPVLIGLARHADKEGRGAYPSQELLAEYARKSDRAVRNDLTALEKAGLIRAGNPSLVDHFPPDRRPLVWDLACEKRREMKATDRKPTSGRSTGRKHTSSRSTAGNTSENRRNRRSERNDRKHTSTRTDRKHTSTRSTESPQRETAGQRGTTGSTLPPKLSNYVGTQAGSTRVPDWAKPLIDALGIKGIAVSWSRTSNLQWVIVQQLMKSHGIPYLVHLAGTRWNPRNPIKFGTLLIDIWREYDAPPVGSPWHPSRQTQTTPGPGTQKPPHCGHPDCDPASRLRETEDDQGLRRVHPCPDCHPNVQKGHAA